jgi:hypothetical protein
MAAVAVADDEATRDFAGHKFLLNNLSIRSSLSQATNRVAPFHDLSGVSMCDKCVDLDGKIEHYQRMLSMITDQRTIDGNQGIDSEHEGTKSRASSRAGKVKLTVLDQGEALATPDGVDDLLSVRRSQSALVGGPTE